MKALQGVSLEAEKGNLSVLKATKVYPEYRSEPILFIPCSQALRGVVGEEIFRLNSDISHQGGEPGPNGKVVGARSSLNAELKALRTRSADIAVNCRYMAK